MCFPGIPTTPLKGLKVRTCTGLPGADFAFEKEAIVIEFAMTKVLLVLM